MSTPATCRDTVAQFSSLKSMTAIWMGLSTVMQEADAHQLDVQGDPDLARTIQKWLGLSVFAAVPRKAP